MWLNLKGYLIAAGGVIVAVFLAVFSYRGKKIDALEQDVETERENVKEVERVIEKQKAVEKIQERYDEINADINKSSSSVKRERLSGFFRD